MILLIAGKYCDFEIIQKLLSEADIKPDEINHSDDTVLHVFTYILYSTNSSVHTRGNNN